MLLLLGDNKFNMAILGKDILHQHGPYIDFSVFDVSPIQDERWPAREVYEKGIFFELSDDLLSCYCSVTRSYSPFDAYALTQLTKPQQIYEFAAKLLMWELQITTSPDFYFTQELDIYNSTELQLESTNITLGKLKADLLETLHYIVGQLHQAAASGQCIVIMGI